MPDPHFPYAVFATLASRARISGPKWPLDPSRGPNRCQMGCPTRIQRGAQCKAAKKKSHAPQKNARTAAAQAGARQKKQLKCARRDSNPGRGRSRGRPFFARPKPHHPSMRLGGRALESVLFMPENEEATPPIWVRGAAAEGRRGCTLAKDHKKCGLLIIQYAVFATFASRARTEAPKGPFPTS